MHGTKCLRGLVLLSALLCPRTSLGSTFIKGGLLFHPREDVYLNDRWFAAAGAEWPVAPSTFLGFEVHSAYVDQYVGGKVHHRFVPLDVFFTAKWRTAQSSVRPYFGGGVGLASGWVWSDYTSWGVVPQRVTDLDYEAGLGYEFLGGLELGSGWLLEFLVRYSYSGYAFSGLQLSSSVVAGYHW